MLSLICCLSGVGLNGMTEVLRTRIIQRPLPSYPTKLLNFTLDLCTRKDPLLHSSTQFPNSSPPPKNLNDYRIMTDICKILSSLFILGIQNLHCRGRDLTTSLIDRSKSEQWC